MSTTTANWLANIENEVLVRAEKAVARDYLVVDYYRIRRKIAYPLPLNELVVPRFPTSTLPAYPWTIWMLWALEEHIGPLGYAAEWNGNENFRQVANRDLNAMANWSAFRQLDKPDLLLGHSARLLFTALRDWSWIDSNTRSAINGAFERIVADNLSLATNYFSRFATVRDVVTLVDPRSALHNIPIIGTVGVALAAHALQHPAIEELHRCLKTITLGLLEWRRRGFAEGVCYDGYVMDFLVHWLAETDPETRKEILAHDRFGDLFDESLHLAVPGDVVGVAELGDVEPHQMPFHLSAHAKLLALAPNPHAEWMLRRAAASRLRTDALVALRANAEIANYNGEAPAAEPSDAHYAITLRSGWDADDLAVVASLTTSSMGHLHLDAGSVVIGTRGHWLIGDPGYQQYLQRSERNFTLDATAHNCPVINGQPQSAKPTSRSFTSANSGDGLQHMTLDITSAYSFADCSVRSVKRDVWLYRNEWVVIADSIEGNPESIEYTWHGAPQAAWWVADNTAHVHLEECTLYISAPGIPLDTSMVDRLRGSRGQLSLGVRISNPSPVIWWVFSLNRILPATVSTDCRTLSIDGQTCRVD